MRKLLPLLLLFCSLNAYSQWGVKAGVNSSIVTGSGVCNYRYSGHIGGTYEWKLSRKWYLQPELLFTSVGYNLQNDGIVLKGGYLDIYALELPVNLSFRPVIRKQTKLLLDFGIYGRCGLFGNKTYTYYNNPKIEGSPFKAYNRFDTGINLGLGLEKDHLYGVLAFQRGVTHAQKGGDDYHRVFRLSLGYKF